ncbi:hypothetical protein ATE92_2739 [Ulvibacter sp. MAR_2010_11]|uniref:energy transducer TonB n=1 Tax=Ulvibacter sp. MAR_2010_11 TaxID=1250229 RepID=UPI000CAB4AEA|nr:hypothetical protein [Ulvibacter sp. MAR_2010_11]PKA84543.1 hypothetical protein ATE92_2739 [Ulvibacter sp. MAR_2010_11]
MKRNILIISTICSVLNLMSCDFSTNNDLVAKQSEYVVSEEQAENTQVKETIKKKIFSDFVHEIGPRFNAFKKSDLENARSFSDFIGAAHALRIVSYKSLSVIMLEGEEQTDRVEISNTGDLTTAQIKLLQSANYSANILIKAEYKEKNVETGQVEDSHWTPYLTVVPEKQAAFFNGMEVLKDYLMNSSKETRLHVDSKKLQPAMLFFTVTKSGAIEKANLDRSSGYPIVDEKMIELISKTTGAWEPAENSKGEKVDQELVVSFGLPGC